MDLGKQCFSPVTSAAMQRSISKSMELLLINKLQTIDLPLSLIVDSSTSHGNEHFLSKFKHIQSIMLLL